jgi:hypothetical protein
MAEIRGSGTWGSALSADEFAAIKSVGFEPVGQVLGAAVYNIGYTGGYNCPGAWAGYGGFVTPTRGITAVSGQSSLGSFGPMVQTLYEARRKAISRMEAECQELGGHGSPSGPSRRAAWSSRRSGRRSARPARCR